MNRHFHNEPMTTETFIDVFKSSKTFCLTTSAIVIESRSCPKGGVENNISTIKQHAFVRKKGVAASFILLNSKGSASASQTIDYKPQPFFRWLRGEISRKNTSQTLEKLDGCLAASRTARTLSSVSYSELGSLFLCKKRQTKNVFFINLRSVRCHRS